VLHRCHFSAGKEHQKQVEELIRNYIIRSAAILHMQKNILHQKDNYVLLSGALQLELNQARETLLFLFSFLYDRDQISKIKRALEINKKETIANAIELVDMTVKKEFANPFNAVFEQGDIEHRCMLLTSLFPKDIYTEMEAILSEILSDSDLFYNNWSKACTFYVSKQNRNAVRQSLIGKYRESPQLLLKEMAEYAERIN
jgi:hypothetical protein